MLGGGEDFNQKRNVRFLWAKNYLQLMMNGKIGEIHSFGYSDGWTGGRLAGWPVAKRDIKANSVQLPIACWN